MNNQLIYSVNNADAVGLQNTFVIDVSKPAEAVETRSYLVTLEQTDGSSQTLQLTEDELEALGLKAYFVSTNSASCRDLASTVHQLKNSDDEASIDKRNPLTVCESSIQILSNGDSGYSIQNTNSSDQKLITDAKLSGQKEENGVLVGEDTGKDFVYRVVYPEELNLKPVFSKPEKRGRPKKRAAPSSTETDTLQTTEEKPVKSARTRSGRITRPPRHIEKDFEKIDISEQRENEEDFTTTEFTPLTTSQLVIGEPKLFEPLSNSPKKRNISSKYKCPKCQKAYLGRSRMLKHLEDNPDHGPIPEHCKTNNFELWNYLVDVTRKCPPGKRGLKFCEELSNLLQNLRILARYLFKFSNEKNAVAVDKLLGAVLDLAPGSYKFNEIELHKDLTIFKMLNEMKCFDETNQMESRNQKTPLSQNPPFKTTVTNPDIISVSENTAEVTTEENVLMPSFSRNGKESQYLKQGEQQQPDNRTESLTNPDGSLSLHTELLAENSLLNSLPNLRSSVDDLILTGVDSANVAQLFNNSASSDEAINVDQLINERLKTITGPDIDLSNSALGLDLPTLDLFHFHHS